MEYNANQIFSELSKDISLSDLNISGLDVQNNAFFCDLVEQIVEQFHQNNQIQGKQTVKRKQTSQYLLKDVKQFTEIKNIVNKILPKISAIKIKKGTIIYTPGMPPDEGYMLVHGCVQLLSKKNNWEKLQSFEGHTLFKPEQRIEYLLDNYNIDPKYFQVLQNLFFEQKLLFNFLPFHKIYSGGYFGFRQLQRGCLRAKMAIAVEDSLIIKIKKIDFDRYLKEIEQKRQLYIIYNIVSSTRTEIAQQILPKLPYAFNSAEIITYDRDQAIINEKDWTSGIYFLLSGQVVVSKDVKIQVPKKYLDNQNRGDFTKQITVNLHKIVKNTFVGQIQPLMSIKNRQFSFVASLNQTVLIKFDATAFMKVIAESSHYQRQLTMGAKYKFSTSMQAYTRQMKSLIKTYFSQFEELDHKKKEKNITNLLNNDNFKQNQLYELFKKEGVFYRDSFERLEGFDKFQSNYDPKRSSIHRHKIKSTLQINPISQSKSKIKRQIKYSQEKSPINQNDYSFEATKRLLMSPGKSSNPFQMMNSEMMSKLVPHSEHISKDRQQSSSNIRKKKKMFSKFQELKKDQNIYKRVLIQNGRFQKDKQTNKSNLVKAIVNHQFDQVVKKCMTRKSPNIRKALIDHRDDIIKYEFQKTVSSLPYRSTSMSRLGSVSYGFTCKGTEQMRKKMQKFKFTPRVATNISEKINENQRGLEDCIGFNRQPMSSEIKTRSTFMSPTKSVNRSPQKIVLLNHMMKPITYTTSQSTQL